MRSRFHGDDLSSWLGAALRLPERWTDNPDEINSKAHAAAGATRRERAKAAACRRSETLRAPVAGAATANGGCESGAPATPIGRRAGHGTKQTAGCSDPPAEDESGGREHGDVTRGTRGSRPATGLPVGAISRCARWAGWPRWRLACDGRAPAMGSAGGGRTGALRVRVAEIPPAVVRTRPYRTSTSRLFGLPVRRLNTCDSL